MKKKKYIIIVIAIIFLSISVYIKNYNSINKKISRDLGVYIPNSLKFEYEDTHGGFFGDGITLAEGRLNEKQTHEIITKSNINWIKDPMPKETRDLIYNKKLHDEDTELVESSRGISDIGNGYWIFKDRRSNELKKRFPTSIGNYSVGIIDLDTNTFYYIKFDS